MSFRYISKIGLEVESGFSKKLKNLHSDDSLRSDQFYKSACYGELISEPLSTKEEVISWLQDAYKDISETPVCAAYHIHVSFKHINYYSQCMTREFLDAFLAHIKKWAEDYPIRNEAFWDRLNGKNKYCQLDFRADKQSVCKTKDEMRKDHLRWTVLNYCFGLHKTIENRLFPTFVTAHAAISATESYLNFIEDYLDKHPVSEDEIKLEIVDENHFQDNEQSAQIISKEIKLKPFNLYKLGKRQMREYKDKGEIYERDPYNSLLKGMKKQPKVSAVFLD